MDRKEGFQLYHTLTGLVKCLQGIRTTVDLRNESSVTGVIAYVDGYMNIDLENALYIDPTGKERVFDNFFVRKRNVRYVHIPKEYSPVDMLEGLVHRGPRVPKPKKRLTFKKSRAQKKQLETILYAFGETGENVEDEGSD